MTNDLGLIVGLSVGSAVILIVVVTVVACLLCRNKSKGINRTLETESPGSRVPENGTKVSGKPDPETRSHSDKPKSSHNVTQASEMTALPDYLIRKEGPADNMGSTDDGIGAIWNSGELYKPRMGPDWAVFGSGNV